MFGKGHKHVRKDGPAGHRQPAQAQIEFAKNVYHISHDGFDAIGRSNQANKPV